MKVPRKVMMNEFSEFKKVKTQGQSRVGKYLILSTLLDSTLPHNKFAFITSNKVGKAHERNFVRRRFRDLISRHGDTLTDYRYLVMIGRYSSPNVDFSLLEKEFIKLGTSLKIFEDK